MGCINSTSLSNPSQSIAYLIYSSHDAARTFHKSVFSSASLNSMFNQLTSVFSDKNFCRTMSACEDVLVFKIWMFVYLTSTHSSTMEGNDMTETRQKFVFFFLGFLMTQQTWLAYLMDGHALDNSMYCVAPLRQMLQIKLALLPVKMYYTGQTSPSSEILNTSCLAG